MDSQVDSSDLRLDKRYYSLQMVIREKEKELLAYNQAVQIQKNDIERYKKRITKLSEGDKSEVNELKQVVLEEKDKQKQLKKELDYAQRCLRKQGQALEGEVSSEERIRGLMRQVKDQATKIFEVKQQLDQNEKYTLVLHEKNCKL